MVTTTGSPSGRLSTCPRTFAMVTGRPNRLRAAVAPSAKKQPRLQDRAFLIEPPAATFDLIGIRALVQATLSARLEFEVLDGVGDEYFAAIDTRFLDRLVEHPSGWSDERPARQSSWCPGCSPPPEASPAPALPPAPPAWRRGRAGSAYRPLRPAGAPPTARSASPRQCLPAEDHQPNEFSLKKLHPRVCYGTRPREKTYQSKHHRLS